MFTSTASVTIKDPELLLNLIQEKLFSVATPLFEFDLSDDLIMIYVDGALSSDWTISDTFVHHDGSDIQLESLLFRPEGVDEKKKLYVKVVLHLSTGQLSAVQAVVTVYNEKNRWSPNILVLNLLAR